MRIGVLVCVAVSCLIAVGRLDDAVAVFDFQADANLAATFNERTYPEIEWLTGGGKVMEDARLWMPEDASYRVVDGPTISASRSGSLRTFLVILLMPRSQTELESVRWVFCHGCTRSTLGPAEYEVLSDSGHGFLFARRSP